MMDAGQTVEQPGGWLDGHLADWLGDKRQLGLGQARERGTGAALGEHVGGSLFGGSLFGGSVLVPWGVPLCVRVLGVFNLVQTTLANGCS